MQHLSSKHGQLSWSNSADCQMQNGLDVHVVNDPCESTFGVSSDKITSYNRISMTNAGDVALCKKNGDFASGHKKANKNGRTCVCKH